MAKGYEGIPEMDASPRNMDDDQVQGGSDEQIRDIGEEDDEFDEGDEGDEEEEEEEEDGGV